jgi:hypothetical protein
MPHGLPDWWGAAPKSTTYGLQDMAELAARLGSPVTFDRRGDVVFLTSFENGLAGWSVSGTGTGAYAIPCTTPVRTKGTAIKIATGNLASDEGAIVREVPFPTLGKIGLEASFVVYPGIRYAGIEMLFYTGTHLTQFVCLYKHTTGELYIYTDAGWIRIGTPGIVFENYTHFNTMKLVGDILLGRYERLLWNQHTYILTSYGPNVTSEPSIRRLAVGIYDIAHVDGSPYIKVCDVILTQNEP